MTETQTKIKPLDILKFDKPMDQTWRFATLNKNCTLQEYQTETDKGEFNYDKARITHIVVLALSDYLHFTNNLMDNYDWFPHTGGTGSDHISIYNDDPNWGTKLVNDEKEFKKWRAEAYRETFLVTHSHFNSINEIFPMFVVDPQGYFCARYVGL